MPDFESLAANLPAAELSAGPYPVEPGRQRPELIYRSVQSVLLNSQSGSRWPERRRNRRFYYPKAIRLTPLDAEGNPIHEAVIVVMGRYLSDQGVDFLHVEPIPYRRILASFACGDERWISFLLDLTWCRFTQQGWYENGGRFLDVVEITLPRS